MLGADLRSSIMDNLVNAHGWSNQEDLVPGTMVKLNTSDTTKVATIGRGGKPPLYRGC